MTPAIEVENLSKRYILGANQTNSLNGKMKEVATWSIRQTKRLLTGMAQEKPAPPAELWALNGVSLKINHGEIVGIVGKNGNGKSTLLKILSRITMPTHGRVKIHGSLASLLEVGTGFHPELSGRENIFLNGAILGMSKSDILSKLDEIVAFSEVEKFLDTPVKRYSSGMYVRLAFAVAAHLEPDILLVDEVLAVGDGAFQKKCLGKMRNVGDSNRTVLFVSHSLPAVRSICSRVIMIDQGKILMDGPTDTVLTAYNQHLQAPRRIADDGLGWRLLRSNGTVRITSLTAVDRLDSPTWNFKQGQDVRLRVHYEAYESAPSLGVYIELTSLHSGEVVTTIQRPVQEEAVAAGSKGTLEIHLPSIPLRAGDYSLTLALSDVSGERRFDYLDDRNNLPWLSISSEAQSPGLMGGYFSMPAHVEAIA